MKINISISLEIDWKQIDIKKKKINIPTIDNYNIEWFMNQKPNTKRIKSSRYPKDKMKLLMDDLHNWRKKIKDLVDITWYKKGSLHTIYWNYKNNNFKL